MPEINYFSDGVDYELSHQISITKWLHLVVEKENSISGELSIIFTSDEHLLKINKEFLKHDFYTDVITFPNDSKEVSGEIYISIDRVKENAKSLDVDFSNELNRVMVHGMLHLIGYDDKDVVTRDQMKTKEDFYLNLLNF